MAATSLRSAIKNGSMNLLCSDSDAQETIRKVSGYKSMSTLEQQSLIVPYVQTTLAVNEMINLDHEIVNNKVKLKERSGMRKDRFSSLMYNHYVSQILSNDLKPVDVEYDIVQQLTIRPAKHSIGF